MDDLDFHRRKLLRDVKAFELDQRGKIKASSQAITNLTSIVKCSAIDRENNVIRGYVVAETGTFKSMRGRFNSDSLDAMVTKWPVNGLRCRFHHPSEGQDGLGSLVGRSINPRVVGNKLLADLKLSKTSFNSPQGNIGGYVMDLAEEDPDAFSSSLVILPFRLRETDNKGNPILDEYGNEVPPLWMPAFLFASDVVEFGDAAGAFLHKSDSLSLQERELKLLKMRFANG